MVELKGKKDSYFFDEDRPLTFPIKFSVLFRGENKTGKLPPSKLSNHEINEILITGMNSRYATIEIFIQELVSVLNYNDSLRNRLLQFFYR